MAMESSKQGLRRIKFGNTKGNTMLRPDKSHRRRGHAALSLLCAAAALGSAAALRPALHGARDYTPAFAVNEQNQEAANSTPFALILGEVRTTMADLMWVKTERYLHNGVAYGAHLDLQAMTASGEVKDKASAPAPAAPAQVHATQPTHARGTAAGDPHEHHAGDHAHADHAAEPGHAGHAHAADHEAHGEAGAHHDHTGHDHGAHDDHDHDHVATLIPTAQGDFRGFVGALQREIQPWQDPEAPHVHSEGGELLPWYRVMTIANPRHVRGYMIGSWWLTKQGAAPDERAFGVKQAEQFVGEGIRNNPEAFTLRIMRARIYIAQERYAEAVDDLTVARDNALKLRTPDGAEQQGVWSESDEEDFGQAVRLIPMLQLRRLNQPEAARASVRDGLRYLPSDRSLNNFRAELGIS